MRDNCREIGCNSLSARIEEISGSNSGSMVGSESIVLSAGGGGGGGDIALDVLRMYGMFGTGHVMDATDMQELIDCCYL